MNKAHVLQVAVGKSHGLLLTNEGVVYSWGTDNVLGQLGRQAPSPKEELKPGPVIIGESQKMETIVQIACGKYHSLALDENGRLYSWGSNHGGQCGIHCEGEQDYVANHYVEKSPIQIAKFHGNDSHHTVKSCSCGPDSSACVTVDGHVWVWGAVSYNIHGAGKKYRGNNNCTKPVKIKEQPDTIAHVPEMVTVNNTVVYTTVATKLLPDQMEAYIAVFKSRSSHLAREQRLRQGGGSGGRGDLREDLGMEELNLMGRQFKEQHTEHVARIKEMEKELKKADKELAAIGRQIMVCDQQDTALSEQAGNLEVERRDTVHATQMQRNLETRLNDISHFKESNRKSKLDLLARHDKQEQKKWQLHQLKIVTEQMKEQVESRQKLLRSLAKGDVKSRSSTSSPVDAAVRVAYNKYKELFDASPDILAGNGKFNGLRDVLVISDRALNDVSSALKEVSASEGASGGDGQQLEDMLSVNLKLRKDINNLISDKVRLAESGTPAIDRSVAGQSVFEGMHQFFKEAAMPDRGSGGAPRSNAAPTSSIVPS